MNAMTQPKLSLEDYLAWEDEQPERHEFYRGEVFARDGERRVHGCLVGNLARVLGNALQGSPFQVFVNSMKLQVGEDIVFYPDVFITCDKTDLSTERIFTAPTVVVEVLSPSTQAYDRGLKFEVYRRIASLREYILIDPDTWRIDAFRRNEQGQWLLFDMSGATQLELPSVGVSVPLAEVFDGVDPPKPGASPAD